MQDDLSGKEPKKKISAPDNNDQLIVQPRFPSWIVLVGLLVILVSLFFGFLNITLNITAEGEGIFVGNQSPGTPHSLAGGEVLLFIPFIEGQNVQPGMSAHISPLSIGQDEYAYVEGTVAHITQWPLTREEMTKTLNNNSELANYYISHTNGPPLLVRVTLDPAPGSTDLYLQSPQAPRPFIIRYGTPCEGTILISRQKVYEQLFPSH
jgi:hypothetical protein